MASRVRTCHARLGRDLHSWSSVACAQGLSQCSSSSSSTRALVAPAASGCAYGSRRRSRCQRRSPRLRRRHVGEVRSVAATRGRRLLIVTRAAQEVDWSLYAAMSLRRYVATPLCLFVVTSLCREVRTRVCDGRALCMCVMAVQRCTGVVGTCVARPRPQSAFANG